MAVLYDLGYLETSYLTPYSYLSGLLGYGLGMQVRPLVSQETGMEIKVSYPQHMICGTYLNTFPYLTDPYLGPQICALQGMQVDMAVTGPNSTQMQTEMITKGLKTTGMEIKISYFQHMICGTYLNTFPYLTDPYLGPQICVLGSSQVEMFIVSEADDEFTGMQVNQHIFDTKETGMQTLMRVFTEEPLGMQVNQLKAVLTSLQATMSIYNTDRLRILQTFPSRGLTVGNWTSPEGTEVGDFGLDNLNTDVLEQRAQSPSGILANWELRCDTGAANNYPDTFAILSHNFTTSASVTVQASDDNFATIKYSFVMVTEMTDMYYIAPTLPTIPARYYRFIIQDPTNPDVDGSLKIGAIIFGSAIIISRRTCFENPVAFGLKHFKDSLPTEGFSAVSNDRAMRKVLHLEFNNLRIDGADYRLFKNYFRFAKTDLKCLIIPKPERPSALAVFSKLTELPIETHEANTEDDWRVGFELDYDESN